MALMDRLPSRSQLQSAACTWNCGNCISTLDPDHPRAHGRPAATAPLVACFPEISRSKHAGLSWFGLSVEGFTGTDRLSCGSVSSMDEGGSAAFAAINIESVIGQSVCERRAWRGPCV